MEASAGTLIALGFTWLCTRIEVNPLTRTGQVSGLAALQFRFLLVFVGLALVWWAVSRRISRPLALRLACCSLAGLATGLYAGGIAVALTGTTWPLNGPFGDSGQLQIWVGEIQEGRPISGVYPPLFPHTLAYWTELFYPGEPHAALKTLGLVLLAMTGPAAYLAWRMVLPPLWSLGIGVVSVFPIVHAGKPYVDIVLIILIPVLAKLMSTLRRAGGLGTRLLLVLGASYGLGLAVLFLWYSGWFVWSAPGALAAFALMLIHLYRDGGVAALRRGALLLGVTGGVFLALTGRYLGRMLAGSGTPDVYFYFDTDVDPAYFLMWQGDQPNNLAKVAWPLPGELGGVGVFALLLVAGVAVSLWLGPRLPVVQIAGLCMLGAFGLRYWFASHMERDQVVQLYPRTSAELLYCSIVLCGMAGYLVTQKLTGRSAYAIINGRKGPVPSLRASGAVLCALAFFFSMAGSATVDRFMPFNGAWGQLAWNSHTTVQPDGTCPRFAPQGKCDQQPAPAG
ncbi:hypothetical protein ACFP3U_21290 [Kitasatospora misakiensis]|uniref:Galactan 5-O-arabinofuranosyltransferase n=1 Tax=Kitasatospora misakiensis TaxID=67330 RepID=A0ABW0X8B0_9ACTN